MFACRAPDSIGVGANASQFDMLGHDQNTLLTNQTGMGYGVGVWAEWSLNKPTQPITWEWPQTPPYYLNIRDPKPSTTIMVGDEKEKTGGIDQAMNAVQKIDGMSPTMQFGFWLFLIVVVGFVGRRIADHYLHRKSKP